MNQALTVVLAEYEERARAEASLQQQLSLQEAAHRYDEWLLPVGPATGSLLNLLVKESRARSILEIGMSYGYSALWLGEAAAATGGKVMSLEIHPGKAEYACTQLARAGLGSYVEARVGDARDTIAALPGPFDFVLIDLRKDLYIPCFDLIYPKLRPGALVVADNMLEPEWARPQGKEYRRHVLSQLKMNSVLLPIGSGIELSRFQPEDW